MESKDILIQDLKYLEADLSREELISIVFLLFGAENPKWALEQLQQLEQASGATNFLTKYAKTHENWKSAIIEALAVMEIFELIRKLGVKPSEARVFARTSSILNPGLKLLFDLCESLVKELSEKFIKIIKEKCNSATIESADQLEIFLLHAIVGDKIRVDQSLESSDFSLVHQFKASCEIADEDVLKVIEKFPSRPNAMDNSNAGNFNNSTAAVHAAPSLLGNYVTKKMLVLIINQQTFTRATSVDLVQMLPENDLAERKGTTKDMEALQALFESFNYQVITKTNLTHVEILREIEKTTKQSSKYDGLIVCILSHGHEGIFYGSNSVPVFVRDVKETMSSKILLNKPKILFIQACQGNSLQRSVKKIIPRTELDGPTSSALISGSTRADFLIFWSTIEGFASVRDVVNGSWFIQELVKKIRESYRSQNLLEICTAVTNEVSLKRGYRDECMLPKFESTFTKNFRFPH